MGDNNARCHNTQRVTVVEGEGSVSVINWEPRAIILQVDSTSGVLVNVNSLIIGFRISGQEIQLRRIARRQSSPR